MLTAWKDSPWDLACDEDITDEVVCEFQDKPLQFRGGPQALTPDATQSMPFFPDLMRKHVKLVSVAGKIPVLNSIASELFLGSISIEIEEDPEISDRRYVEVSVEVVGKSPKEVIALREEWYCKMQTLLGDGSEFVSLVVMVKDGRQ